MTDLDANDRRLIAALQRNARASVTELAGALGLSRATVHTRLNRLVERGVIRRFTVELDPAADVEAVRAVMLIELQGALGRSVTRRLRGIPQIASLHSTNGAWDLVAQIETGSLAEFDQVLRQVREIQGVVNSETCLLLDTA